MFQYHCTIGIPASNEENTILSILSDILRDILMFAENWQIIIVVNGCSDHTFDNILQFLGSRTKFLGEEIIDDIKWLTFTQNRHVLKICEITEKSKARALNIIHTHAQSERVIMLDADIRISDTLLLTMSRTLINNPSFAVVTPRYQGIIEPFNLKRGCLDFFRVLVNHAINQFDATIPRLDGKAFGYNFTLLQEYINIIPVDTWVEGLAWTKSNGCIYIQGVTATYQFPTTFQDLSRQYVRYIKSLQFFEKNYPDLYTPILIGRQLGKREWQGKTNLLARAIGWVFIRWVLIYALLSKVHIDMRGATWEAISTTKRTNI